MQQVDLININNNSEVLNTSTHLVYDEKPDEGCEADISWFPGDDVPLKIKD